MERRILIPPRLPAELPLGGGHAARAVWDLAGATMGTYWRARVVEAEGLTPQRAEAVLAEALATVVAAMSPWEPASDLARYRAAAAGTWAPLGEHTCRVLARALEVAALTGGRYDPTIGRLTDALGFGPAGEAGAAAPGSPEAERARAATGHARAALDAPGRRVYQPGGYALDLCSIAKGYAIDLALARLAAAGARSCFLEIGGEARGRGCKPDGQPWWCLLEPPAPDCGLPRTIAAASDLALATSGNARRTRALPGGPLGHLLNPLPAEPLPPGLETVTVLAPTCMEADVWATALFLLGPERGLALATAQGLAALFVERAPGSGSDEATGRGTYRERWSPGFAEYLQ